MPKDARLTEVVLTGGPAGGKTTLFAALVDVLRMDGYHVIAVPEIPTIVIPAAIGDMGALRAGDETRYLTVQETMLGMQIDTRHRFLDIARALGHPRTVLLYDQGEAGWVPYIGWAAYHAMLARRSMSSETVLDQYDLVVHCQSTAALSDTLYTLDNPARYETPDQARTTDEIMLDAWDRHPSRVILPATLDVNDKIAAGIEAVNDYLER